MPLLVAPRQELLGGTPQSTFGWQYFDAEACLLPSALRMVGREQSGGVRLLQSHQSQQCEMLSDESGEVTRRR